MITITPLSKAGITNVPLLLRVLYKLLLASIPLTLKQVYTTRSVESTPTPNPKPTTKRNRNKRAKTAHTATESLALRPPTTPPSCTSVLTQVTQDVGCESSATWFDSAIQSAATMPVGTSWMTSTSTSTATDMTPTNTLATIDEEGDEMDYVEYMLAPDGCAQHDETDTCMVMDVSPPAVAETSECHDYYSDNGKPYPLPLWGSCMWNARRDFHRLTPVHGYNGFASIGHPSVPCITLHPSPPTTYDDRLEAWPNNLSAPFQLHLLYPTYATESDGFYGYPGKGGFEYEAFHTDGAVIQILQRAESVEEFEAASGAITESTPAVDVEVTAPVASPTESATTSKSWDELELDEDDGEWPDDWYTGAGKVASVSAAQSEQPVAAPEPVAASVPVSAPVPTSPAPSTAPSLLDDDGISVMHYSDDEAVDTEDEDDKPKDAVPEWRRKSNGTGKGKAAETVVKLPPPTPTAPALTMADWTLEDDEDDNEVDWVPDAWYEAVGRVKPSAASVSCR